MQPDRRGMLPTRGARMVRDWWIYADDSASAREPFAGPYASDMEAMNAAVNEHHVHHYVHHFTIEWTWRGTNEPRGAGL
jgi:hypothetical protein